MKTGALKFGALALSLAQVAQAGFRDPLQTSGERSLDLNYVAPQSRNASGPSVAAAKPPLAASSAKTALSAPDAPNSPAKAPSRSPASAVSVAYPPLAPSPALPGRLNLEIPGVQIPAGIGPSVRRDSTPAVMAPRNRDELHKFSRNARLQLLPTRTYPEHPRSLEIAARYAPALKIVPPRSFRTALKLSLEKVSKPENPPSPMQYENMVRRLDALFDGLNLKYPAGISALYELSRARDNPRELQARDALFAGILTRRAGWEAIAGNLLEQGALKRIDADERYLGILWQELEQFTNISHVDRITANVSARRAQRLAPVGDKANYSMAKRALASAVAPGSRAETFEQRIEKPIYRERLQMIRALGQFRDKNAPREAAFAVLRKIESEGEPELREEARLALARGLLQKGDTSESLELYRRVKKTGANRLEVLGEQSYAEYRSGLFQDSLGKSMGLQSPYFQFGFAPDIHLVEIVSRKAQCDFGGAEAGIQRLHERYVPELLALQTTLAQKADPAAFYSELISYHGKAEPMRYERFLLRLAPVMENQKVLNQALRELEQIDRFGLKRKFEERPAAWNDFAQSMRAEWGNRAGALKGDSAQVALAEAEYMANRLRQIFAQVELLGLDVATSSAKNFNLQSALNFPVRKIASAVEAGKLHWPFEDEIWEDELDFLKMKNPSKCAQSLSSLHP